MEVWHPLPFFPWPFSLTVSLAKGRHRFFPHPRMNPSSNIFPSLSLVVPLDEEEDNVAPLLARIHEGLAGYAGAWELFCVDDGSRDGTGRVLQAAGADYGPHVRVIRLRRNFGQAIVAAIRLTLRHRPETKYQKPERQVRVTKGPDRIRLVDVPSEPRLGTVTAQEGKPE